MVRGNPTKVQRRIMEHAEYLFDLSWNQAIDETTININVHPDDRDDLETFMSLHNYVKKYQFEDTPHGYEDMSFHKE